MADEITWDEEQRSAALHSYDVLDTPREEDFDDLARVASEICGAPIAVVNLVDTTRQFFKAEVGLGVRSTPLETAFCRHALLLEDTMVVPDATKDPRFDCNPLVTDAPHIRAYAGALLKTPEGLPIGTVCVLDYNVREFSDQQIRMLRFLAKQTMTQLELRKRIALQRRLLLRTRKAEQEKTNFERVVRQSSDFIGIANERGEVVFLNDAARALVGLASDVQPPKSVIDYLAEADKAAFLEEIKPAIKSGNSCEQELRLRNFATGVEVPALFSMFPIKDGDGQLIGYGVVTKDITAQAEEAERKAQIMAEAAHRIKNTLSIVQAIVHQTLKNSPTLEQGRDAIVKRVNALAMAQDILMGAGNSAADIMSVVTSALAPHEAGDGRLSWDGPDHRLEPPQAIGLSLGLHELATNAVKYGALSGDVGNVKITWTVEADGRFELQWTEQDGPPVVEPISTGFGSRLIRRMIGPYFTGETTLEFPPEGVRFRLTGKLPPKSGTIDQ
ncbi:PAS domain-containing protein [Agrobacterium sp. AGB01]|uniref:sensor histidine kinase n=1 Tax=Agrobacterium sp. AGB01 TaxID=2769302 RepID=UPI00177E8CB5|nr:HWE histidine kinase domain-containing protein [Agrobacterium sp. AGB01]MBD9388460.1 PAS domain-containing protein [Agrobacterium sp. AGB01]